MALPEPCASGDDAVPLSAPIAQVDLTSMEVRAVYLDEPILVPALSARSALTRILAYQNE